MTEERSPQEQISIKTRKNRNSTGINGLDLALEGGFPIGKSILLIGSPTSGVDRFAEQFWKISPEKRRYFMLDSPSGEGMIPARKLNPDEIFLCASDQGIIIDSISSLILLHGIEKVIKEIDDSREKMESLGEHLLVTMYRGLHQMYDEILLIRRCDIVIELHEEVHGNELVRTLEVRKISGIQPPGRVLPFIVTDKGIELSTTSRVV